MKVKIKSLTSETPKYKTAGSAGMDLKAHLEEIRVIKKGERDLIPTGIFIELPPGYEAQIRARSGLSIKNGIALVNGVGTIDSDYRGEIMIPIINLGSKDFVIENGDRIAQMVIAKYETIEWEEVDQLDELEDTERGAGGFGHTGV